MFTSIEYIKGLRPEVLQAYKMYKGLDKSFNKVEMIQDNSVLTEKEKEIVAFYL